MRRIIFVIMTLVCVLGFAQENREIKYQERVDTLLTQIQDDTEFLRYKYGNEQQTKEFKLYPTQNMWTFLELNTATGQIYQIQFSMKSNERLYVTVNAEILDTSYRKYVGRDTGRFELYPTQNIYTFLLLDRKIGSVWQVQWGFKNEDRFISKIK
ncbi:hypothetical protein ACR77X_13935 [Bacteroides salyersiae]|uniref:hypothetical protein n=1 Tax=Bacteroides salyersiae TaxID=291644 RepID=UPI003DA2606C